MTKPGRNQKKESKSKVENKMGKAKLIYRHSTSFHGFQMDELKSAMQKAIRRGQSSTACKAFAEMSNMLQLFPGQTLAKSIRTNALNRVIICALEDVGVANPPLVLYTLQSLLPMSWKKKRAEFDFELVISCIELLAASEKSRVTSWLHHAYAVPANRELSEAEGLCWRSLDLRHADLSEPNCFRYSEAEEAGLVRRIGEQGRLGHWLALAWSQLSERRPALSLGLALAYFHLPQPHDQPGPPLTQQEGGHNTEAEGEGGGGSGLDNSAREGKTKSREDKADNKVRRDHQGVAKTGKTGKAGAPSEAWLLALQSHAYELVLGEEAFDVHTAKGRRAGRTGADFRTVGAHVENEAMQFHDERLYRVYTNTRKGLA